MKVFQMSKTDSYLFSTEFDPELIRQVDEVLANYDIDLDYLVSEFLHKIARDKKLPFKLKQPNAKTRAALEKIMNLEAI